MRYAMVSALLCALVFAVPASADVEIRITPGGLQPSDVTVSAGEAVQFTNDSGATQTVVHDALPARFDSGPIPAGGGYSLALPVSGVFEYASGPLARGTLRVVLNEIEGPGDAPVAEHIPDIAFPPAADGDVGLHPRFAVRASRSRIMLAFREGATVAEANDALADAGVVALGGLPRLRMLLVQAPSTADFSGLSGALAALRTHPAVETAAMSTAVTPTTLPPHANPALTASPFEWQWSLAEGGEGGNWGLEASRFPQAWNLRDAARAPVDTVVLDGGFAPHPDLDTMVVRDGALALCRGILRACTRNQPEEHGTAVASVLGAVSAGGLNGANPVARMHGVPAEGLSADGRDGPEVQTYDATIQAVELVLANQASAFPHLRVINLSLNEAGFDDPATGQLYTDIHGNTEWWRLHPDGCGPGEDDDETAVELETCTPANEDGWLQEFAELGELARTAAVEATVANVAIVQGAGNQSALFCRENEACPPVPATSTAAFAWASAHWRVNPARNPILIAESIGKDRTRAATSNTFPHDGGISAPGTEIAVAGPDAPGYRIASGTSYAAPLVSALVGYVLALQPGLHAAEARDVVLETARGDVSGGAQPRVDAFAAVMAVDGAQRKLVDVDDRRRDGNLRQILGTPNRVVRAQVRPDGKVDMRDFRRFRDAWLYICKTASVRDAGCPARGEIVLDGPLDHASHNLNGDACVDLGVDLVPPIRTTPECAQDAPHENLFPRYDYNGDGRLEIPADLDVVRGEWSAEPDPREGWSWTRLPELMTSADLHVHASDFYDLLDDAGEEGAKKELEIEVTPLDENEPLPPPRTLTLEGPDDYAVVTVPAGEVEVRASATAGGNTYRAVPLHLAPLRAGEDRRVDVCPVYVQLTASADTLPADGESQILVTGRAHTCSDQIHGVADKPVSLSLSPSGEDHATLTPATLRTSATGEFEARLTAGTVDAEYTVTATIELAEEQTITGRVRLRTAPKLKIGYVWKLDVLDWHEDGTTRWFNWVPGAEPPHYPVVGGFRAPPPWWDVDHPSRWYALLEGTTPDMPDCAQVHQAIQFCINHSHVGLNPNVDSEGLLREGRITGGGSSFRLDESVGRNRMYSQQTLDYSPASSVSEDTRTHVRLASMWNVRDDQRNRYDDHALAKVSARDDADGVTVFGLDELAGLTYQHELAWNVVSTDYTGPPDYFDLFHRPREVSPLRSELALNGEPDDFRYAKELGAPLRFLRGEEPGTLQRYRSCTEVERPLDFGPAYHDLEDPQPWLPGWDTIKRTRVFDWGLPSRPLPVQTGRLRMRISFAAVAVYEDDVLPDIAVPNCFDGGTPRPPHAAFDYGTPGFRSLAEGRRVQFTDASADPDDDIESYRWEFGDGATSSEQDPEHFFTDNGTYRVTLTVTDAEGNTDTATKQVYVRNLPPEPHIEDATGQAGQPIAVSVNLWDQGSTDRLGLDWTLTSALDEFPAQSGTLPSGPHTLTVPALPPGEYPVTLTLTDSSRASASAEATITVTEGPVDDQPPVDAPPVPTCDPDVTLDVAESLFFDLVNDYRAENGVPPLRAVSPKLTRAARAHNQDMDAHEFFDHVSPVDGSTPTGRAAREGYAGSVGENILFSPSVSPLSALNLWKGSPVHNANMLKPFWQTVGIDRLAGTHSGLPVMFWTTVYGDVAECPAAELAREASADEGRAIPAFTASRVSPLAGEDVEIVNRSRSVDGMPLSARVEPDDLAPGAVTRRSFEAGDAEVRLIAAGRTVTRTLHVRPRATALNYGGAVRGAAGGRVHVSARLTEAGGAPVAARTVSFALGDASVTASTGGDGVAETFLDLPDGLAPGAYELVVRFGGDAVRAAVERRVGFAIAAGRPPVANAGGPYQVAGSEPLTLDGSASTDPDDLIVVYEWDLDGDGEFDDASGAVTTVGFVCDDSCPIRLRVTDTLGLTDTAQATVTAVRDFGLSVAPSSQLVRPGERTGFAISVIERGFTGPVTLSIEGLPAGYTATFDANPVTPTGTTVVQITPPASAPQGDVHFTIVATGGALRREAGGTASVTFGLIPTCYGGYTGKVTDSETDAPLAGVQVGGWDGGITAADGTYTATNVPLGNDNAPQSRWVATLHNDYWQEQTFARALCGVATRVDFQLVRRRTGALAGRVADAATGAPLDGARVAVTGVLGATSGADGRYAVAGIGLAHRNAPANYDVSAELDGFWTKTRRTTVSAEGVTDLPFELVRKCHATFVGGRVLDQRGQPVPGAQLYFEGFSAQADAQGNYRFDVEVLLGPDNTARTASVLADGHSTSFQIDECGRQLRVDALVTVPVRNYATLEGYVRDQESGSPVAGAVIQGVSTTDAAGHYTAQVLVGDDDVRTRQMAIRAFADQYWDSDAHTVTLTADQTTRQDITLLRMRFGSVEGTVRDAVSGSPLAGARIRRVGDALPLATTDLAGAYAFGNRSLGLRNAPRNETYRADATGYWPQDLVATLRADGPAELDYALVKRCEGATVAGRVVNALTRQPIADALLDTSDGSGARRTTRTGTDGRFTLTDVSSGPNNAPFTVQLTASAPGFITQTKPVTVFCGATLTIDFGDVQTQPGVIAGTVVDGRTRAPVAGAFVGSEFGRSATTDTQGRYRLEGAPLGDGGADREWHVTVLAAGYVTQTQAAVARAGAETTADFALSDGANPPPVAHPQTVATDEDRGVDIALAATGTGLSFTVVRGPRHGTLIGTGPVLRYEPARDFNGSDDFEFVAGDGSLTSEPATVAIAVASINDPPECAPPAFTATEGVPFSDRVSCTDIDDGTLTYELVSGTPTLAADGTFTYTPGAPGQEYFVFRARDPHGATATAEAAVAITAVGDKQPPICVLGPPHGTWIEYTVRDAGSGLQRIEVTMAQNAKMTVPTFTPGTTAPVQVRETKIKASKPSMSELRITDRAGNVTTCDPVLTTLVPGARQRFGKLHQNVHKLVLKNGRPGLRSLVIGVNGRVFRLTRLKAGRTYRLDLAKAMRPGPVNRITVLPRGKRGATAALVISD